MGCGKNSGRRPGKRSRTAVSYPWSMFQIPGFPAVRSVRGLLFSICWGLATGTGCLSCFAGETAGGGAPIFFDIPPQSLPKALTAFSKISGIEVLVDARNVDGRQTARVAGLMAPPDALQLLLTGTALVAREFTPGTVTLMRAAEPSPPAVSPYFAVLQQAVLRALCQGEATAPGGYRLALKLWIAPSGILAGAKRLDSTGDPARDAAVDAVLPGLDIGARPPADLPQPIALVVLPRPLRESSACPSGIAAARRAADR